MTIPKPLTYDEQKAAEAAFRGGSPDPEWTNSAKVIYVQLSTAVLRRGTGPLVLDHPEALETVSR